MNRPDRPYTMGSKVLYVIVLALVGLAVMLVVVLLFGLYSATTIDDEFASVSRHPDAEPGKGCGRIGNITIKYNTADLFFPATYENIDYWGGDLHLNKTKWCDDRLSGINFPVDWPTMAAPENWMAFYYGSDYRGYDDPKHIAIKINHNYAADPAASMKSILVGWITDYSDTLSYDEIKTAGHRIKRLGLYSIEPDHLSSRFPHVTETVYWDENAENEVTVLIRCKIYGTLNSSDCTQSMPDPVRGIWVKVYYRVELLDHWKELHASSLAFVDSLTVSQKDTP